MLESFESTSIYTKNPTELVKFYNEKLGLPIQFEGFGGNDGAKIAFSRTEPGIVIWDETKWGRLATGIVNFVFSCDNLDKTYEEFKSRGVELEPPIVMEWGGRELNLVDLEGNKITILEHRY